MANHSLINTVLAKAVQVATHSWEYGSVAQALLEWNNATLSIWNAPFPDDDDDDDEVPTLDWNHVDALEYAKPFIRTNDTTLVDGDGEFDTIRYDTIRYDMFMYCAAGDPAALGISALLIGKTCPEYYAAAIRQAEHLVDDVPRWPNGAISSLLLRNYLDDESWWGEISGTSLLAATAFRVAVVAPDVFGEAYTSWAQAKLDVVDGKIDEATGIVGPAINPLNWHDREQYFGASPEGQSFVVLMHAAERDWKAEIYA
ncbi:hypothetical protein K504DRAFT_43264 [Pleomassaria siparia CBS 279.74]|uniref:Uncharacterized protein n=1 Tax=Pleomassaria siparia CBS 279.74 TaxID=1314801 RepID=A0A6G1K5N4_9PLEO|nr:hypothetical protein K504DRAFT_43264 [Pleomassaria siparia CBS 279.74]